MSKDLVKKEYTDAEKVRIAKYLERVKREPVKFKKSSKVDSGGLALVNDIPLSIVGLTEALGTPDLDLQNYLIAQVVKTFEGYVSREGFNDNRLSEFTNEALALLNGIQPQDEVEG
ncbi:MAG: hypothetical protein NTX46_03655, partial [Chloroflexi bacterium]|nr:hypothetical protein [Chloroflexota bacterium]